MKQSDYIYQRDLLIPEAEEHADKQYPEDKEDVVVWASNWNHCFHDKMNELWAERNFELMFKAEMGV